MRGLAHSHISVVFKWSGVAFAVFGTFLVT